MASFGLFLNTGLFPGMTHSAVYDLALAEVDLAEGFGFRDVWVTEHHFIPFGINSSALAMAGFLLGKTSMRVGTAVTLAPLYHPFQLAEQALVLDQLSKGRFDFGIGRGGYLQDFELFDVPLERWDTEVESTAATLLSAWRSGEVPNPNPEAEEHGAVLNPLGHTRPHPPLFIATTSQPALELAAANRLPLLHYWATPAKARVKVEERYRAAGGGADAEHVHTLPVAIGDDVGELRERLNANLTRSFATGDWPHVPQAKDRHLGADGAPADSHQLAGEVADMVIAGPPEAVAEALRTFIAKTNARRLVLFFEPLADPKAVLRSLRRFGEEVLPLLGD